MKKIWSDRYKIHSYEADTKGQATPSVLCKFMQESAWNHAEHLELGYTHLIKDNLVWVMARKKFRIHRYPKWGETITVETWPSGQEKLLFYRDFRISNGQGDELGIASTVWFIIDIDTRRPKRVGRALEFKDWNLQQVFDKLPKKIIPVEFTQPGPQVTVRYYDLDVNDHVNNIRYIDWVIDTYDHDFLQNHSLREMEINFLSESHCGQELEIFHHRDKPGIPDFHRISRRDKDVVLATSLWQKHEI